MNLDSAAAIGEIISAVAVVISVVYLAIQVRGNTRATQAASVQNMLDGARDRIVNPTITNSEVADVHARGLSSFDELDRIEKTRFTFLLIEHVVQLQNVLSLHKQGLLSEVDYTTWLAYVGAFIRTPGGRKVWPQVIQVVDKEVGLELERHLREEPDLPSLIDMMPILDTRKD